MAAVVDAADPRVEELDDDDVPELVAQTNSAVMDDESEKGATKGERKARKAIAKLGLKLVEGIERVTLKKSKNTMFVIANPDVYKSPGTDSYVVFGEAKIEDLAAKQAEEARLQREQAAYQQAASAPTPAPAADSGVTEEQVDESGVSPKDIDLVVSQAGCTRAEAVKALKNNPDDIVNAIMELTMS